MRIEEILFWIFMITALLLIILRAFGSPPIETIFTIFGGTFLLLWREIHSSKIEIAKINSKLDLIWLEFRKRKRI